jgi:A/G-specific adenine glycosylase
MPRTYDELLELPGIGPYTAAAVMAFAYDTALPLIETNVRAALIHHFFPMRGKITDAELMPLVEAVLDRAHPREWYGALMDYGTYIKKSEGNAARRSAHHVKQKRFAGSDRQIRGAILKVLALRPATPARITKETSLASARIRAQLDALTREGMVVRKKGAYMLP